MLPIDVTRVVGSSWADGVVGSVSNVTPGKPSSIRNAEWVSGLIAEPAVELGRPVTIAELGIVPPSLIAHGVTVLSTVEPFRFNTVAEPVSWLITAMLVVKSDDAP